MPSLIALLLISALLVLGCRSTPVPTDHLNHVRWLPSMQKTQDNGSGTCQVILSKWKMMEYLDLESEEQCQQRSKYVIQSPFLVSYQSVADSLSTGDQVSEMRKKISQAVGNAPVEVDILTADEIKNLLFDRLLAKNDGSFSLEQDMNDVVRYRIINAVDTGAAADALKLRKSELKGSYEGEDSGDVKYFFGTFPAAVSIDDESAVGYEVKMSV